VITMTEHDISPHRTSEHHTTTPGIADTPGIPGIPGIAATRGVADDSELRARALKRLKDKRDLKAHLLAYVTVNLLLVGIWAAAGGGFFWPVFPILGWGIGVAFHIWDVVSPEPGPREVEAEMERLRTRGR
jgi:hypothetical protein